MLPDPPHRKTVRHYDITGHARELTFSCYSRMPLLDSDVRRRLLSAAINAAIARHQFQLVSFVYMPEHVHLIVFPRVEGTSISSLLFAIKKPFSYRVKLMMQAEGDSLLDRLTIRERPEKTTFRFWQEGGGYDRNLIKIETLHEAIRYIHRNPIRRKLCLSPSKWKWSSWRHYHEPDLPPDPDLPEIDGILR